MSNYLEEEIFPNKLSIASWENTKRMFEQICSNEKIALVLYDMLGHSEFVLLLETNSIISKAIKKHSHVQLILLKLKVSKLKERELKRQSLIFLGVDYNFFNPFIFPQMLVNLPNEEQEPILNVENNRQDKNEIQQIKNNDLAMRNKWKTFSTRQNPGLFLFGLHSNSQKTVKKIEAKPIELSDSQKLQIISSAESILATKRMKRDELINETKNTIDKVESERRERFVERYFGQDNKKEKQMSISPQIESFQKKRADDLNLACLKIIEFGEEKESLWKTVTRKIENSIFGEIKSCQSYSIKSE